MILDFELLYDHRKTYQPRLFIYIYIYITRRIRKYYSFTFAEKVEGATTQSWYDLTLGA